jgi:hypothetical protein
MWLAARGEGAGASHCGATQDLQACLNATARFGITAAVVMQAGICSMRQEHSMPKIFFALAFAWMIVVGGLLITPVGPICIVCGAEATRTPNAGEFVAGVITIVVGVLGLFATVALNPQPLPPRGSLRQ